MKGVKVTFCIFVKTIHCCINVTQLSGNVTTSEANHAEIISCCQPQGSLEAKGTTAVRGTAHFRSGVYNKFLLRLDLDLSTLHYVT